MTSVKSGVNLGLFFLFSLAVINLSGCFSSRTTLPVDPRPFKIQVNAIEALTLMGSDLESNSPWIASLSQKSGEWSLDSVSTSSSLSDHHANQGLILHLLDSISTLKLQEPGPNVPFNSLGLEPPRFALRWRSAKGTQELSIGNPSKDQVHMNVSLDGKTSWLATGAVFPVLHQIQKWQDLRSPTWVTESPDDINEVIVRSGKQTLFYAQRDGDHWGDPSHRPVKPDVDQLLDELIRHSWTKILESTPEATSLQGSLQTQPDTTIILTPRAGTPIPLALKKQKGTLYGYNPTRPGCVFVLDDSKIKVLKKL